MSIVRLIKLVVDFVTPKYKPEKKYMRGGLVDG